MEISKFGISLLILGLMISHASAADVIITPSSRAVTQGQTFNLNVSIDPKGTAIAGTQLNIEFNKSVLNVNGITEGNLFRQNGASTFFNGGVINNLLGTVVNIFDAILGRTNVSTPGTFIIINATAISSSGTSGINISNVKIAAPSGTEVALNVINGSVIINTAPPASTPSIYGITFNDANGNKIYDSGEAGLQGWTIKLMGYDTVSQNIINTQTITDENGYYSFTGLNPGNYYLFSGSISGWIATTPSIYIVDVTPGSSSERNFGNRQI